jgi:hypothetical protein
MYLAYQGRILHTLLAFMFIAATAMRRDVRDEGVDIKMQSIEP